MSTLDIKTNLWPHLLILSGIFWSYPVASQIVSDQTLGINQSTVNPTTVNGVPVNVINGGLSIDGNLLHSFQEFNIPAGNGAKFSNPNGINTILARVTGQNISTINGILGVLGDADLVFLNPNGIIFGGTASLDINGSFLATTAQNILFSNGSKFGNSDFQGAPSSNLKITGLEFLPSSGSITVTGNGHNLASSDTNVFMPLTRNSNSDGLQVQPSKSIGLFANGIQFNGGIVSASSGNIDIGSVAQGTINITKNENGLSSNLYGGTLLSDINLTNRSLIENVGNSNKRINLTGNNISLSNGSIALATTNELAPIPNQSADSKIQVTATGLVSISEFSDAINSTPSSFRTETLGSSNGSNITISAANLEVLNGGRIQTFTFGPGEGGNIEIDVKEDINLDSFSQSPFASNDNGTLIGTSTTLSGNGGNLNLSANNLTLRDGASIAISNFNAGNAGTINLNIDDSISLFGTLRVISADGLLIPNGLLTPANSSITTVTLGSKPSGNISVQTNSLHLEGGGVLGTISLAAGNSGNVYIDAKESVNLIGFHPITNLPSFINSASLSSGDSGTIRINTRDLSLIDGGTISASSFDSGNAGFIDINSKDSITISGSPSPTTFSVIRATSTTLNQTLSDIFNFSGNGPSGDSLGINIMTNSLLIQDGGNISVQNDGLNDAGDLTIQANELKIDNASIIGTSAFGNGGNFSIQTDLLILNGGLISSSAEGTGLGGNININSNLVVAFGDSLISANAVNSSGGNIFLDTLSFFSSPNTEISATSALGPQFNGTVTINNPDTDLELSTTPLVTEVNDPEVAAICRPTASSTSEFIVSGEGGLPQGTNDSLSENVGWHDDALGGSEQPNPVYAQAPELEDAQGWVTNAEGTISLVASTTVPITTAENPSLCNAQVPTPNSTVPVSPSSLRSDTLSTGSESTASPSPSALAPGAAPH